MELRVGCIVCHHAIDPFVDDFYLDETMETNEVGELVQSGGAGYCDACLTQSGLRPLLGKERAGSD